MWPFSTESDSDFIQAERVIYEELNERYGRVIKIEGIKGFAESFFKGFEIGYKYCKGITKKYQNFHKDDTSFHIVDGKKKYYMLGDQIDDEISSELNTCGEYLKIENLNDSTKIYWLGHIIGFLMALFRYEPLAIFRKHTKKLANAIKNLKDKPNIYKMVKESLNTFVIMRINRHTQGFTNIDRDIPNKKMWIEIYDKYRYLSKELFA